MVNLGAWLLSSAMSRLRRVMLCASRRFSWVLAKLLVESICCGLEDKSVGFGSRALSS